MRQKHINPNLRRLILVNLYIGFCYACYLYSIDFFDQLESGVNSFETDTVFVTLFYGLIFLAGLGLYAWFNPKPDFPKPVTRKQFIAILCLTFLFGCMFIGITKTYPVVYLANKHGYFLCAPPNSRHSFTFVKGAYIPLSTHKLHFCKMESPLRIQPRSELFLPVIR